MPARERPQADEIRRLPPEGDKQASGGRAFAREHITGLVLAGGRGSRMGGVDKGLQLHRGVPLAAHVLARFAPQVGPMLISANRHLDRYEAFGMPVCADAPEPRDAGPLAGLLAGLTRCRTRYLAAAPCDAPNLPVDLVMRLAAALAAADAEVAIAMTRPDCKPHPVCCLVSADLADDLARHLLQGGRKVLAWMKSRRCAEAWFEDAAGFANLNTLDDLNRTR